MTYFVHQGDLPDGLVWGDAVAVDTETMGLQHARDRLCVVQLSNGNGDAHLVQFRSGKYEAPNLKALMEDRGCVKIFHFARFDIAALKAYLAADVFPVYCTKTASRLVRTFTDSHGLKDLCWDVLGVKISKQQQTSDWGAQELTKDQIAYAASDVLYLHELRRKLDAMLRREGREELAQRCFDFLPVRAALDLAGWAEQDIFSHATR